MNEIDHSSHNITGSHMANSEIDNLESTFDSPECADYIDNILLGQLDNQIAIGVFKRCFSGHVFTA